MSIRQPAMDPETIEKWKAVRDLAVCVLPETADEESEVHKKAAELCEKAEAIRKQSGKMLWLLEAHYGQSKNGSIPVMEGSVFGILEQIRRLAIGMARPEASAEWMFACKRIIRSTWRVEAVVSTQVLSGKTTPEKDALTLLFEDSTAEDALVEELRLGNFHWMSMAGQESHHKRGTGRRGQEPAIIQKFKQIREFAMVDPHEDAACLWHCGWSIRTLSNEILQLLDHECDECEEVEDYANEDSVMPIFCDIWKLTRDILSSEAAKECMVIIAHADWVQACSRRILCASRRIEELLAPECTMGVLSSADREAAFFLPAPGQTDESGTVTQPTALPHGSLPFDTWSHFDQEPAGLVESGGDGADIIARQELEHKLLELKNKHPSKRHPEIAAVLHALGQAWNMAGNLQEAKRHFQEALQLNCSLHVNKCLPDTASQLLALGHLHLRTGDISEAKLYLENSLKMKRALIALVQLPPCLHLAKCTCGRKTSPKQKTTWKSL